MASQNGPIFPSREPIAGTFLVTPRWSRWLLLLRQAVDATPIALKRVTKADQTAALPTTPMDGGNLSAGLFAVSWALSVVVSQVASTAQVTIAWTDDGQARSYVASVMDGSIAANVQVDKHLLIYADSGTPISYAVAYAGTFTYTFRVILQSVSAG